MFDSLYKKHQASLGALTARVGDDWLRHPPPKCYIWTHPLNASTKFDKNEGIDAVIYSVYLIE